MLNCAAYDSKKYPLVGRSYDAVADNNISIQVNSIVRTGNIVLTIVGMHIDFKFPLEWFD